MATERLRIKTYTQTAEMLVKNLLEYLDVCFWEENDDFIVNEFSDVIESTMTFIKGNIKEHLYKFEPCTT